MIYDFFVRCVRKDGEKWLDSYVRFDAIKSIHQVDYDPNRCIFYTYKDVWYVCQVSAATLMERLNQYYLAKVQKFIKEE